MIPLDDLRPGEVYRFYIDNPSAPLEPALDACFMNLEPAGRGRGVWIVVHVVHNAAERWRIRSSCVVNIRRLRQRRRA